MYIVHTKNPRYGDEVGLESTMLGAALQERSAPTSDPENAQQGCEDKCDPFAVSSVVRPL